MSDSNVTIRIEEEFIALVLTISGIGAIYGYRDGVLPPTDAILVMLFLILVAPFLILVTLGRLQ